MLLLLCLTMLHPLAFSQNTSDETVSKLWKGIGGAEPWSQGQFLMFTCHGNLTALPVDGANSRTHLWDKKRNNCRFEMNSPDQRKIVVIYSPLTSQGQLFIEGIKVTDKAKENLWIETAQTYFHHDLMFLCLPLWIAQLQASNLEGINERLHGNKRILNSRAKGNNTNFPGKILSLDVQMQIDTETGRLAFATLNTKPSSPEIVLSGFKDVGGGLILPTHFKSSSTGEALQFSVVASLLDIELEKFTKP